MIRHVPWRALPLAALLVLAPLPFASIEPRFSTLLFLAVLVASAPLVLSRGERAEAKTIRAIAALAAVGALGALQARPWPMPMVEALAPGIAQLSNQAADLLGPGSKPVATPLSLAPESSRAASFDWLLPAAAALAGLLAGRSRRARRWLLAALVASASIQIAIGIQLRVARSSTLWGVALPTTANRIRGSYVNPNHLALLLEIALVVALAWALWALRRSIEDEERAESRLVRLGPPALFCLLLFAGLILTGSRAGALAAFAAIAAQGWLLGRRRGRRWILTSLAVVLLAGVAWWFFFGIEGALERLVSTPLDEGGVVGRLRAARATLDLWELAPWTGIGLGAFRAAFPLVQPESLPGLWRHAHSDWVELLATGGVVGFALLLAGLFFYLRRLREVIARGERSEDRAAGVAATGALVAVGLHSFVDFGLTMPANAFALAVVLGAAAAAKTRAPGEASSAE